jgi:hypothetical protein
MRGIQLFAVVLVILSPICAEDVAFHDSLLSALDGAKGIKVDLTVSDAGFKIQGKKGSTISVGVLYSAIRKMSHEEATHHRIDNGSKLMMIAPGLGLITMATKAKSHWLTIDYDGDDGTPQTIVLRLDRLEYYEVIMNLQTRSGKQVEMLDAKNSGLDPTVGSKDVDEVIPFSAKKTAIALKSAMEMFGCKVKNEPPHRIECKRASVESERTGIGGELVIATLDEEGSQTRLRIKTEKSAMRMKNWSTPIYNQMRATLDAQLNEQHDED